MVETLKVFTKTILKPSNAWLALFFPALFYYFGNALHSLGLFRSSTYGEILKHELMLIRSLSSHSTNNLSSTKDLCYEFLTSINSKNKILYIQNNKNCHNLLYPLYLVHDDFDNGSISSTTWMENDELGRGYLLISTSAEKGKIYQWETGGGPIAIGRTLNLNDSGCRSNIYKNCSDGDNNIDETGKKTATANRDVNYHTGSGGIVVDTYRSDSSRRLIVAEYGEGRIVRVEENGARTPLVIETRKFNDDDDDNINRLCRPFQLLMTPYGDLLIIDDATHHGGGFDLWRLRKASSVPALPSLSVSRRAHAWNRNNNTGLPHIFFQSNGMGGMVLDNSGQRIYVTTFDLESSSVLVVSLPLLDDLDDDDDDDDDDEKKIKDRESTNNQRERVARELQSKQNIIVFNYTANANAPGAIETDNNGNLYLAVENGIIVVSSSSNSQSIVAKISFFAGERIVDLTLGSDRFLYIAMESKLARVRVPNSQLEIQTELLIKA
mmetsp:Transcript_57972/g.64795  ORF Transcript_57972/g.64795 Transcript_57972/m.64795 type:complete len:495 (-) Transcript_57972:78-1562(-)